jgi:superfamily II DNA or RNA helicase
MPTGAGKTYFFSEVARSALGRGSITWIIVPRNELLEQSSESLKQIGVAHGRIAPRFDESEAYQLHVVSKDTLIRRYEKIKRSPDLIIIDECHIALDRYTEISEKFPRARLLGVTATPERLDGRGLSELFEVMIQGPSITELIESDYLTPIRYFAPPIEGIKDLKRAGVDYAAADLAELLESRKIYGKAIEHYRRHCDGRPALVYCRSVAAAAETAERFSAAGYRFENIDGRMSYKKRRLLIDALKAGQIHGLTSCELITYGLDVPRVECVIMLRPTLSRTLFMQMIGRGLRPSPGKTELIVLDHVGNLAEFGHPLEPHEWQFNGREKRRREKAENPAILRLCPDLDFLYCNKPSCAGCQHNRSGRTVRKFEEIDAELTEAEAPPLKLGERPREERREINDRIGRAVDEFKAAGGNPKIAGGAVLELVELADCLGRSPIWVYHLLSENRHLINVPLLHEIARIKKYKPGWAYFQKQRLLKG